MMTKTQKIILAVIIIIILMLIIAIATFMSTGTVKVNKSAQEEQTSQPSEEMRKKQSEEAARETQKLIKEVEEIESRIEDKEKNKGSAYQKVVEITVEDEGDGSTTTSSSTVTKKGVVVAPGNSMIDVETGEVLTGEGKKADNTADSSSPDSPSPSFVLDDSEELPESSVKVGIYEGRIEPGEFTVKAGQAVSLAVTSYSKYGDIFKFEDESLKGVSVGVGNNETRSITFNAPDELGEYIYFSNVRRQKQNGAVGTMIVE